MKKAGCRARAILPPSGSPDKLRITNPHNHPPDENATEKEEFLKSLNAAASSIPGSLKVIYDNVAVLYVVRIIFYAGLFILCLCRYPKGAAELPYRRISSRMRRARRNVDMC